METLVLFFMIQSYLVNAIGGYENNYAVHNSLSIGEEVASSEYERCKYLLEFAKKNGVENRLIYDKNGNLVGSITDMIIEARLAWDENKEELFEAWLSKWAQTGYDDFSELSYLVEGSQE